MSVLRERAINGTGAEAHCSPGGRSLTRHAIEPVVRGVRYKIRSPPLLSSLTLACLLHEKPDC